MHAIPWKRLLLPYPLGEHWFQQVVLKTVCIKPVAFSWRWSLRPRPRIQSFTQASYRTGELRFGIQKATNFRAGRFTEGVRSQFGWLLSRSVLLNPSWRDPSRPTGGGCPSGSLGVPLQGRRRHPGHDSPSKFSFSCVPCVAFLFFDSCKRHHMKHVCDPEGFRSSSCTCTGCHRGSALRLLFIHGELAIKEGSILEELLLWRTFISPLSRKKLLPVAARNDRK